MSQCFDCPELGDFEGRPPPRAHCCMSPAGRDEFEAKRIAEEKAAEAAARPANDMPNRAQRRRAAREARRGTP